MGEALLVEVLRAFELIERHPDAWHPLTGNARRCHLRRFPYGVIYTRIDDDILILAIAHLHRRPDYWRERIEGENP